MKYHDYTLPKEAEETLRVAVQMIDNYDYYAGRELVIEARERLLQYLNQDNEIEAYE